MCMRISVCVCVWDTDTKYQESDICDLLYVYDSARWSLATYSSFQKHMADPIIFILKINAIFFFSSISFPFFFTDLVLRFQLRRFYLIDSHLHYRVLLSSSIYLWCRVRVVMSERKRSAVWLYFTNLENAQKAKCNFCKTDLSYKGGSTSNLKKHLQNKHPSIDIDDLSLRKAKESLAERDDADYDDPSESAMSDPSPSTSKNVESTNMDVRNLPTQVNLPKITIRRPTQSKLSSYISKPLSIVRQKRIDDLVCNVIIKDLQSVSIVEDEGFTDLIHYLEPSYKFPSRKTLINSLLCQKEATVRENLMKLLPEIKHFSITNRLLDIQKHGKLYGCYISFY